MKKVFKSILCLVMIVMCTFVLVGCTNEKEKGELSRVTVDVNPSIELMVDEDKKVISCSALNDDGSIIIVGEAIVGKDVDEATELIVNLCTETGYIVKGEATVSKNEVSISVSGDSEYAKKLASELKQSAQEALDKSGISAVVTEVNSLAIAELKVLVLNNSTFTEEEVEAMTEEQLLQALKVSRLETAELVSEEMKKLYYEAKEYEISFAEKQATADVIKGLGSAYTLVVTGYEQALQLYKAAIQKAEDTKYNTLIAPTSAYQKALVELRNAKVKFVEQRSFVASLEVGDIKINAEEKLKDLEEQYNKLEAAFVKLGDELVKSFDTVIEGMKKAEESFESLEQMLKQFNLEAALTEKATEIETAMNKAKDEFFTKFEDAHKEDIQKMEAELKAQKEALKDSILNNKEA